MPLDAVSKITTIAHLLIHATTLFRFPAVVLDLDDKDRLIVAVENNKEVGCVTAVVYGRVLRSDVAVEGVGMYKPPSPRLLPLLSIPFILPF